MSRWPCGTNPYAVHNGEIVESAAARRLDPYSKAWYLAETLARLSGQPGARIREIERGEICRGWVRAAAKPYHILEVPMAPQIAAFVLIRGAELGGERTGANVGGSGLVEASLPRWLGRARLAPVAAEAVLRAAAPDEWAVLESARRFELAGRLAREAGYLRPGERVKPAPLIGSHAGWIIGATDHYLLMRLDGRAGEIVAHDLARFQRGSDPRRLTGRDVVIAYRWGGATAHEKPESSEAAVPHPHPAWTSAEQAEPVPAGRFAGGRGRIAGEHTASGTWSGPTGRRRTPLPDMLTALPAMP